MCVLLNLFVIMPTFSLTRFFFLIEIQQKKSVEHLVDFYDQFSWGKVWRGHVQIQTRIKTWFRLRIESWLWGWIGLEQIFMTSFILNGGNLVKSTVLMIWKGNWLFQFWFDAELKWRVWIWESESKSLLCSSLLSFLLPPHRFDQSA